MKIESKASKKDIIACLKINLLRINHSMVVIKSNEMPNSKIVYVLDGLIHESDHDQIKDNLNHFEIPCIDRCIASIRMIFGSPFTVEFNWGLDFKKCQTAMVVITDAMMLNEYLPRKEPLAEDEYGRANMSMSFAELKEMELFIPFEEFKLNQDAEKATEKAAAKITKPEQMKPKSNFSNGKVPISQYRYKRKNANKKKVQTA